MLYQFNIILAPPPPPPPPPPNKTVGGAHRAPGFQMITAQQYPTTLYTPIRDVNLKRGGIIKDSVGNETRFTKNSYLSPYQMLRTSYLKCPCGTYVGLTAPNLIYTLMPK